MKIYPLRSDPLVKEWKRLYTRIKRKGADQTADYLIGLIKTKKYPLWYSKKFIEYSFKHGEFSVAGKVLQALEEAGYKNSLMDEQKSTYLWCMNKRRAALSYALTSAKRWKAPFLYLLVSKFYEIKGQQKKSHHYSEVAHSLAKKEDQLRQAKLNSPRQP